MRIFKNRTYLLLILVIFVHVFFLINLKFTVWPEMVLYPWLLGNGYKLYEGIVNPYFPVLPITLSYIYFLSSDLILLLKIFTWSIILTVDLIVFFSALKITKDYSRSLLAVAVYALLQMSLGGNGLWFELFMSPLVLLGLILIYELPYNRRVVFLAGCLLGVSFFVKQNAILFIFLGLLLLIKKKQLSLIWVFLFPMFLFGSLLVIYLNNAGVMSDFKTWAIFLPLSYSSQNGFVHLPAIRQYLLILFPSMALLSVRKMRDMEFWILALAFATLFAFPRYEDFHLQILVALAAPLAANLQKRYLGIFILVCFLLFARTIDKDWHKNDRFIDQDTLRLAGHIKNYPSVYLLNSPDLAYYFADRLPPRIWAANYPWYFEQEDFEERFVNNLKKERTGYIVIGNRLGGKKYDLGNYIPEKLESYIRLNYQQIEKYNRFDIWRLK